MGAPPGAVGASVAAPAGPPPLLSRHRGRRVVAILVAFLAVLEVGVRLVEDRLPEPLEWHSFEAQRKAEQIAALAADGGVDVVFLGTSMVNAAVITSVFTAAAGDGLTAYNAGLSSGIPRLVEDWAVHLVLPALRPRLVVLGVSSVDLTDAGVGRTVFLDAFRRSAAGRELLGTESTIDRANRWLRSTSALYAHRAELRDPRVVADLLTGADPDRDAVAASIDEGGFVNFRADQQFEDRPPRDGIASLSVWEPGVEDRAALLRTIAAAEELGATVVLVELPVTEEYVAFHPDGAADYDEFEDMLAELAAEAGVPVLDLDVDRDHVRFADELHLNRRGATEFSEDLAAALRSAGLLP